MSLRSWWRRNKPGERTARIDLNIDGQVLAQTVQKVMLQKRVHVTHKADDVVSMKLTIYSYGVPVLEHWMNLLGVPGSDATAEFLSKIRRDPQENK